MTYTGGTRLPSFSSFASALERTSLDTAALKVKKYSLIVCLSRQTSRILLGKKNRGFGTGKYNSFGGKIEQGETPAEGAMRELREETNIKCDLRYMESCLVGDLNFTFEDSSTKMIVTLFSVDLDEERVDCREIVACDEITPCWFGVDEIPYGNMFADDQTWLPVVVEAPASSPPRFDAWYHFLPGGDQTNTVDFYHLPVKTAGASSRSQNAPASAASSMNLLLFDLLHKTSPTSRPKLKPKEYNEAFSFVSACKAFFLSGGNPCRIRTVIDVAGV